MRDRLSKAEGQVKMEAEHSSQLEAALNKVNTELESKMALIKQLQEQVRIQILYIFYKLN